MSARPVAAVQRWWGGLHGRGRSIASVGFVSVAVVGLLVAVFLADGFRATSYDLQDASVWATRERNGLVGRVNTQIAQQDVVLPSGMDDPDVAQDGRDVFLVDRAGAKLTTINVSTVQPVQPSLSLPKGSSADVAGGTLVVTTSSGDTWIGGSDAASSLAPTERDPDLELGDGGAVAISRGGLVVAYSAKDGSVSVLDGGDRSESDLKVDPGAAPGDVQVSAAGDRPVALDRRTTSLLIDGAEPIDLRSFGSEFQLQLPGDDPDEVLVGTDRGLVTIRAGEEPSWVPKGGQGTPTRPVRIAGCSYGAWAGGLEAVACDGNDPITKDLGAASGELRFRVNRKHVILNELTDGKIWFVVDGKIRNVENWELPKDKPTDDPENDEGPAQDPNVAEKNEPPDAINDQLGARPGVASVLTVLDNDVDPNADVLVVSSFQNVTPSDLKVSIIGQGQSLQVEPPPDASGTYSFSYTITDGREAPNSDTATVTLRISKDGENEPPELKPDKPPARFSVESQKTASYDVLQDWWDPDGDPIYLESASVGQGLSDTVQTLPSGILTFSDSGIGTGAKQIDVTVRDAPAVANTPARSTDGKLQVVVEAPLTRIKPIARPDYRATVVGARLVIEPLANDSDGNGDALHIGRLLTDNLQLDKISASFSAVDDTVSVTASAPGSYVFGYEVTDGLDSVPALIRVDVAEATANRPPAAGRDLVVMPNQANAQRTVDLLINDVDPDGDVMVVRSLNADPTGPVSAQLLEHRRLRVTASAELVTPVVLTYVVSDGQSEATGQVVVVSAPSSPLNKAPVLAADAVTVRAGDIVSIPVLANDTDPEGDDLQVTKLVTSPQKDEGIAFVSGANVRFLAPGRPMTVRMSYEASDGVAGNNRVTGQIVVTVRSDGDNAPPVARTVEARVLAGGSVKIVIPLAGLDPDGDSVRLVGLGTKAAELGRVVTPVGTDSIVYEAFPSDRGGTDEFSYRVIDSRGAQVEGTVRIGVAPRPTTNGAPVAGTDRVELQPGGEALVPVLANDYDPDGDALSFGDPALEPVPEGVSAEIDGPKVRVTAPDSTDPVPPLVYRITDGRGGRAYGRIDVIVKDDAKGLPPVARDDDARAPADASTSTVRVKVTKNDDDPDGSVEDLDVATSGPADGVSVEGQDLVVDLGDQPQLVAYTITDPQDLTATAVVRIPARGAAVDRPPVQKPDVGTLKVKDGETLPIEVSKIVEDPEGKPVRVTTGAAASATHGKLAVKETSLTFTPEPGYAGPASITFEVTDGDAADTGNTLVVSLPVTVLSNKSNTPPTVDGGGSLDVAPGEDPVTLDLRQLVSDPDEGDVDRLTFVVTDKKTVPAGVDVELTDDSVISAVDRGDARTGSPSGTVNLTVTDGDPDTEPVPISVTIRVVQSSRPPPTCTQAVIDKADVGTTVSRNVLDDCFNPFPEPLKISDVTTESRYGSVTSSGETIEFTAAKGFVGNGLVRYKVTDRAGRDAQGSVTVVVRDVPGKPSPPTVVDAVSRRVVLSWQPPAPNGSPIDYYTVKSSHGSTKCDATTCEIDGLTNDTRYRFTVTAHNEVGDGEPSDPSAEARPDQKPEAPANVQLTFDKSKPDGQLTATWDKAANEGSPITTYELQISPPPASGPQTQEVGVVTSYTWSGLTNGTSYRVKVRAINAAVTGPGDWSAVSNSEVPANVPDQPVIISVTRVPDPLGELIEVRWTAPPANGDPISGYTLAAFKDGASTPTKTLPPLSGTATSQVVDVDDVQSKYSFQLVATNKAGDSQPSSKSTPVQAERAPDPIGSVTVVNSDGITGLDRRLEISFQRPFNGGVDLETYEVRFNGESRTFEADPGNSNPTLAVTGLANGTPYRFEVKACNSTLCQTVYSPITPIDLPTAVPYGPVGTPSVWASDPNPNPDQVAFNWSPPGQNGQKITGMEISTNGGASWQGVALSGSTLIGSGRNQTYSILVRAIDAATQKTPDNALGTATKTTNQPDPPPSPSITASWGASASSECGGCVWVNYSMRNFARNTSYVIECWNGNSRWYTSSGVFTVRTDGNGNLDIIPNGGTQRRSCFWGYARGGVNVRIGGAISNSI